ncbi:unnamed protein product [Gordionus sp. m RMFG-2023]
MPKQNPIHELKLKPGEGELKKRIREDHGYKAKPNFDIMYSARDLDQGWAWLVMISSFFGCFISAGMCYSYGVYYTAYINQYPDQKILISVLIGLPSALFLLLGPVSVYLSRKIGYHWTVVIGCTVGTLGHLASYFSTQIEFLCFSHGFLVGIGGGILYSPVVCILKLCFVRRYVLANAFGLSGIACGCIIFPFIFHALLKQYGLRGSFIIGASIYMQAYIIAAILAYPSNKCEDSGFGKDLDGGIIGLGINESRGTLTKRVSFIDISGKQSLVSVISAPPVVIAEIIESIKEEEKSLLRSHMSLNVKADGDEDKRLYGDILNDADIQDKNINDKVSNYASDSPEELSSGSDSEKNLISSPKIQSAINHHDSVNDGIVNACNSSDSSRSSIEPKILLPSTFTLPTKIKVKSLKFMLFILYAPFEQTSSIIVLIMITKFAQGLGINSFLSSTLISWIGIGELCGCISIVLWGLHETLDNGSSYTGVFFITGLLGQCIISAILLMNISSKYIHFCLLMLLFGYCYGVRIALLNQLVIDLFGSNKFSLVYGIYFFAAGMGCLVCLPLATWLSNVFDNQLAMFYITTTTFIICLIILTIVSFSVYYSKWKFEKVVSKCKYLVEFKNGIV